MASYRGHLAFSSVLGAAYGAAGVWYFHYDWGPVFLGAGITAIGGLAPDLDSDSGVPIRELFGLAAVVIPVLVLKRIEAFYQGGLFPFERTVVILGLLYLLIRFGLSTVFKHYTVHRGMFHSIPAMLIAGLVVYLPYHGEQRLRYYLAGGMMLGFLSHLVLDEIYSVDFSGAKIRLARSAGSAVKFWSKSSGATLATYLVLGALGYLAWLDYQHLPTTTGRRGDRSRVRSAEWSRARAGVTSLLRKRGRGTPSPPRFECGRTANCLGLVGEREGVRGKEVDRGVPPLTPSLSPATQNRVDALLFFVRGGEGVTHGSLLQKLNATGLTRIPHANICSSTGNAAPG
jgi:hypothetical protein